MTRDFSSETLLSADDPAPVEWVNADSAAPVLFLCEHAGQAIPQSLGNLGVSEDILNGHHGWDIGAEAVARIIAERLNAPLIIQRYSRLVIDCNRPIEAPDSIPEISFGENIPGNVALSQDARRARQQEIFTPLNAAIEQGLAAHPRKAAFSIHSFNPDMAGVERPWHAGFLTRKDEAAGQALLDGIAAQRAGLTMAVNQPYQIDAESDWFLPAYAEPAGLRHALVEIRNDLIRDEAGVSDWADLLSTAIAGFMETL